MKELINIQSKLQAPKNQWNAFGKYNYRSCEDILAAAKDLLETEKCTLTLSDSIEMVGDRIYVKAVARLTNSAGETVETSAYAREEDAKKGMDASQVTGAASSYARKIALNGLFAIDDQKDGDSQEKTPEWKDEIEKATTTADLTVIYKKHEDMHNDKDFMAALSAKRKKVEGN